MPIPSAIESGMTRSDWSIILGMVVTFISYCTLGPTSYYAGSVSYHLFDFTDPRNFSVLAMVLSLATSLFAFVFYYRKEIGEAEAKQYGILQ